MNRRIPVVAIVPAGTGHQVAVAVVIRLALGIAAIDIIVAIVVNAIRADFRDAGIDCRVAIIAVVSAGAGQVAVAVVICQAVGIAAIDVIVTIVVDAIRA